MDAEPPALHAAEPCHLALGKLVDGYLQLAEHFVAGGFTDDVFRHVFVLKAIVYKVFGWNPAIQQSTDFLRHSLVEPCLQSPGDFLSAVLAVDVHAKYHVWNLRECPLGHGRLQVVLFNPASPDGALGGVHVGGVVHRGARQLLQFRL